MCDIAKSEGERRLILLNIKSDKTILTLAQMEERRLIEIIEVTQELENIILEELNKRSST
jgi:hypothetical protein